MTLSGEAQAVLVKYGLLAAAIVGVIYYARGVIKSADLNPFDENGALGLSVPKNTPQISGYDKSHDAALAKLGLNIKDYRVYYPNFISGQALPKGTYKVTWGVNKEKITYYVKKSVLDVWSL